MNKINRRSFFALGAAIVAASVLPINTTVPLCQAEYIENILNSVGKLPAGNYVISRPIVFDSTNKNILIEDSSFLCLQDGPIWTWKIEPKTTNTISIRNCSFRYKQKTI